MILGADVFEALMESQRRELSPGLFAPKTIFNCVLVGKQKETVNSFICCHLSVDEAPCKFLEIESLPQKIFYTEAEISGEVLQ